MSRRYLRNWTRRQLRECFGGAPSGCFSAFGPCKDGTRTGGYVRYENRKWQFGPGVCYGTHCRELLTGGTTTVTPRGHANSINGCITGEARSAKALPMIEVWQGGPAFKRFRDMHGGGSSGSLTTLSGRWQVDGTRFCYSRLRGPWERNEMAERDDERAMGERAMIAESGRCCPRHCGNALPCFDKCWGWLRDHATTWAVGVSSSTSCGLCAHEVERWATSSVQQALDSLLFEASSASLPRFVGNASGLIVFVPVGGCCSTSCREGGPSTGLDAAELLRS